MKSSTRKRIALCILILIVGALWWYLLATHQYTKPSHKMINHREPWIHSMFERSIDEFKHREQEINNMFNELENEFTDMDVFEQRSWENHQAKWTFQYMQETNNNWEESSYEVNWNWNEWENTWTMIIKWINNDWKKFSYTWTMENGESKWTLTDEDWNSKPVDFKNININDIYENSNHINN